MSEILGRFITKRSKEFECPDQDCKQKSTLAITCPACKIAGKLEVFHDLEEVRNHFENFYKDEETHQRMNPFRELSIADLNLILETTVRRDETAKGITFLEMLNAQTAEDQTNTMFSASSSTGKSYIPQEIALYFPPNDVIEYAGASPTSFFHEKGTRIIETESEYVPVERFTDPIEREIEELKRQDSADKTKIRELERKLSEINGSAKILVDLENKILIFVDQPNTQLLIKVRPFLSHDKKVIEIPITDKSGHGGNRTKHVLLRGYACVFFCTVSADFDEQEGNRNFILSPESSLTKIEEGLKLLDQKLSDRERFRDRLESDVNRCALIFRIELIRASGIERIITEEGIILKRFREIHDFLNPRAFRDFTRLYALVYGHALFNCFQREKAEDNTIKAIQMDIEAAFQLYEPIMRANESGISPELYNFLTDVIVPASENRRAQIEDDEKELPYGLSYQEIAKAYRDSYHRNVSYPKLRDSLKALSLAGLLLEETDPNDKRRPLFRPNSSETWPAQSGFQNTLSVEESQGILQSAVRHATKESA